MTVADWAQWVPEILHHAPNIPILLVGTKLDLREDPETLDKLRMRKMNPIDYQRGAACAREIGAVRCVCSSSSARADAAATSSARR